MRVFLFTACASLLVAFGLCGEAAAQPTASATLRIEWEVKNRFRLFRNEADFRQHVAAHRNDGVLGAEARLESASNGRGWARTTVDHLCVNAGGRLAENCERDGERENYLTPTDHRVGVNLSGPTPPGASCTWNFDDGTPPPQQIIVKCGEEVRVRLRYGVPTIASVGVTAPDGSIQQATTEIVVRDLLIAGLGDSIAAGEGNPDKPIVLSDGGFCFRNFVGSTRREYYRPGRAGFRGDQTCGTATSDIGGGSKTETHSQWQRQAAGWLNAPCHRSLYGYQMRSALALAVENPQLAVTFIPLACAGATIEAGILNAQRIRECGPTARGTCPGTVPGQVAQLQELLAAAQRQQASRKLDLILLTVGANDVRFSGLVANVILEEGAERSLFNRGGLLATTEEATQVLNTQLPGAFAKLRGALKPLVGGNLSRVVYVSYGHLSLTDGGTPCPGGPDGFDVHPVFSADGTRLRRVSDFFSDQFLPRMKSLALCASGTLCQQAAERMTFVDSHQAAFAEHGFCARSGDDPLFDRKCFSADGESFETDQVRAVQDPLACDMKPSQFRPYAARARWVRTANDSYFTAMTYPDGLPSVLQPADIHDATWGILSAVYGGAIHPTAQGQAAMADAALPALRALLGIEQPPAVTAEPLPPVQ